MHKQTPSTVFTLNHYATFYTFGQRADYPVKIQFITQQDRAGKYIEASVQVSKNWGLKMEVNEADFIHCLKLMLYDLERNKATNIPNVHTANGQRVRTPGHRGTRAKGKKR